MSIASKFEKRMQDDIAGFKAKRFTEGSAIESYLERYPMMVRLMLLIVAACFEIVDIPSRIRHNVRMALLNREHRRLVREKHRLESESR